MAASGGLLNALNVVPIWAMVVRLPPLPAKMPPPLPVSVAPNEATPVWLMLGGKRAEKPDPLAVLATRVNVYCVWAQATAGAANTRIAANNRTGNERIDGASRGTSYCKPQCSGKHCLGPDIHGRKS